MKLCRICNKVSHDLSESDPDEYLRCGCYRVDPRTYWTVIIPYVAEGATIWHPTDENFAPIVRGSFKSRGLAYEWGQLYLNGKDFNLAEHASGTYMPPSFNATILGAAIAKYVKLANRPARLIDGKPVLSDTTRQEVTEHMHDNYPLWIAQFNMDLVEWILSNYHGFKAS